MAVYRSFIRSGLLEREGLRWLAGLKTRVRVGLLVIIVLGLPLSILYKLLSHLVNSCTGVGSTENHRSSRDVGAF